MVDSTSPPAWQSDDDVERVARALCCADRLNPDEDWRYKKLPNGGGFMLDVLTKNPARWTQYAKKACAALEAMRPMISAAETTGLERAELECDELIRKWQRNDNLTRAAAAYDCRNAIRALKPTTGRVG